MDSVGHSHVIITNKIAKNVHLQTSDFIKNEVIFNSEHFNADLLAILLQSLKSINKT